MKISVTFGTKTEVELHRDVNAIISELAALKDIMKLSLADNGHNPSIMEEVVEKSLHLKVLIDLNNEHKHGYPLNRYRSGMQPIIGELQEGLEVPAGETVKSTIEHWTGKVISDKRLNATIVGAVAARNGKPIFSLDEMIDSCLKEYEALAKDYGLA